MKIYIQGFKSIRDGQFIAIGNRLTFLVGPNSAGKSVVLSALEKLSGDGPDFEFDENLVHRSPNKEDEVSACHSLGVEWHKGKTKYGNFATHYTSEVDGFNETQTLKNIHTCKLSAKLDHDSWSGGFELNNRTAIHINEKLYVGTDLLAIRRDLFYNFRNKRKISEFDQIIIDLESLNEKDGQDFRKYLYWAVGVFVSTSEMLEAKTAIENKPDKDIAFLVSVAATWKDHCDNNIFRWDFDLIWRSINRGFQGLEKQQKFNLLE